MKENIVTFMGRLGKDPKLKYTPTRKAVCNFSVAIDQGKNSEPLWKRVTAWERDAEFCSMQLKKGSEVFIRGKEVEDSYKNNKGEIVNYTEVKVWNVGFVSH